MTNTQTTLHSNDMRVRMVTKLCRYSNNLEYWSTVNSTGEMKRKITMTSLS